jgi:hypothetical protein
VRKVIDASEAGAKQTRQKRPEWKEKLGRYMTRLRQQMETTGPKNQEREREQIRVLSEEKGRLAEKMPLPDLKPAAASPAGEKSAPVASAKAIPRKQTEYALSALQRAVVWSEILAPPLALRDR